MTPLLVAAVAVVAAAAIEVFVPGRALYHYGWFNVALLAGVVAAALAARRRFRRAGSGSARASIAAIATGAALAGVATVAGGLFAPDGRTIVGSPGTRVRADELGGTLDFPTLDAPDGGATPPRTVLFDRSGRVPLAVGERARYSGVFALRTTPRTVVYVEARDARGAHLTVTQPSGPSFLSPILLMQQHQTIAGLDVPYDSFAVPAVHRVVKAVLFSAAEAATLRGIANGGPPSPAVLFAVDDDNGRPLPRAIVIARDGTAVAAGGVRLRALVLGYPAVEVASVPSPAAIAAGVGLVLAGIIGSAARPRTKNPSPT